MTTGSKIFFVGCVAAALMLITSSSAAAPANNTMPYVPPVTPPDTHEEPAQPAGPIDLATVILDSATLEAFLTTLAPESQTGGGGAHLLTTKYKYNGYVISATTGTLSANQHPLYVSVYQRPPSVMVVYADYYHNTYTTFNLVNAMTGAKTSITKEQIPQMI